MSTTINHTQEYRFGIVMYGGVSLAIYMNGIAQELLRMVRATACRPDNDNEALRSADDVRGTTEEVYREIGRMLAFGEDIKIHLAPMDPISTRFVVDVISGTSAGGINGIFLAKALVNNQDISELKQLWVDEGDIGKLLNDAQSVQDIRPLPPSDPPQSLLNSRRMYKKLLDAFRGMGRDHPLPQSLVDDLDLAVTTTDVHGSLVELRLLDAPVQERRHRNVFRFRYRTDNQGAGDEWETNPFSGRFSRLHAFAARCTSAFPFAFEPMTLAQADEVTNIFPAHHEAELTPALLVRALGEDGYDVQSAVQDGSAIGGRAFTDGGYLDNKPFSHAIDALANRRSRRPVSRKLLYVEPSPELISPALDAARKRLPLNALDNVRAALLGVPRYETIREDLQRVLQRNRTAERLGRILDQLDDDFTRAFATREPPAGDYGTKYLDQMIGRYGPAYGGYHRLKIAALTDALAAQVARAVRVDPQSDLLVAIRCLVKAWRDARYTDYEQKNHPEIQPSTLFLLSFDLEYRLRRLDFLLNRIERLACLDEKALRLLQAATKSAVYRRDELVDACKSLRDELEKVRAGIHREARTGFAITDDDAADLAATIHGADLDSIIRKFDDERRLGQATEVLLRDQERALRVFDDVAEGLMARVYSITDPASQALKAAVTPANGTSPSDVALRTFLQQEYIRFEDYDQILYTALYGTDMGDERTIVDVMRISPVDAKALSNKPNRLAGFALHHFGAFLDADWRRHDITWGRLDGAERIITALLPDPKLEDKRNELIRRAHIAIIRDQLRGPDHDAMIRLLQRLSSDEARNYARRMRATPGMSATDAEIKTVVASAWSDDSLYAYFKNGSYEMGELDRAAMARVASRSSIIVGQILEGIGGRWGVGGKLAWLTRIARMFWAMVELAIPGSVARAVGLHITTLFLLFALLIALVGFVTGNQNVLAQGTVWFAIGGAFAFIRALLENAIRGRRAWKALVLLIATGVTVVLVWSIQDGLPRVLQRVGVSFNIPHLETGVAIASVVALIGAGVRYLTEIWGGSQRGALTIKGRLKKWALAMFARRAARKLETSLSETLGSVTADRGATIVLEPPSRWGRLKNWLRRK